jgi:hypothetical protein
MSEPAVRTAEGYRSRFRSGPVGVWRSAAAGVTVELAFAPDGSGLGRFVGAGGEDRWRFDWYPAGERAIRVRRARPDRGSDGWDERADEPDLRFAEAEWAVRYDFTDAAEPELFEVGRDGFLAWPCRFRLVGALSADARPDAAPVAVPGPATERPLEVPDSAARRGALFLFWIGVVILVSAVVVGVLGR